MEIENRKLKILIATGIYPPDIGGPATYAKMLVDNWGADAAVLTYTSALRKIPKPFRQLIYLWKTWSQAARADAIYSLSPLGTGVATMWVARWRRKPFFVRVVGDRVWEDAINHGKTSLLIGDFQKTKRGWRQRLQVKVCQRARAVIVPSAYLKRLVHGWGIAPEKIHVVANAVDLVVEPLSKEEARTALGIHGKIILSAGRLVPWKGFRMLIKLMPKLLKLNPFSRLIIVGEGPDREHLTAMIKNLNLQQKVFMAGKKTSSELTRHLRAADLFVLNTSYEGFSHQILEAMAAGVPVVTTNVGGNPELVHQGENGFMVKYNDEFNLIEAVKTLWSNAELREHFANEGKKTASQYTVETMMTKTVDVINLT